MFLLAIVPSFCVWRKAYDNAILNGQRTKAAARQLNAIGLLDNTVRRRRAFQTWIGRICAASGLVFLLA